MTSTAPISEIAFDTHLTEHGNVQIDVVLNGTAIKDQDVGIQAVLYGLKQDFCAFYLFTCNCGVAGCAGFFDSVIYEQSSDGYSTITTEDEKAIRLLGGNRFYFLTSQVHSAVDDLRNRIEEFEKQGKFHIFMTDTLYGDTFDDQTEVGITLQSVHDKNVEWFSQDWRKWV